MHGGWHPHALDPFKRPGHSVARNRPILYPIQYSPGDVCHCNVMDLDFVFPEPAEGQPRHLRFETEQELQNYICTCIAEQDNENNPG
jgi:hypothetical protein